MQIKTRDYKLVKPEDVGTRGAKLLVLFSDLWERYIDGKDPDTEEKEFSSLCDVWLKLVNEIFVEPDDWIKDLKGIPAKSVGDIVQGFFQSSEVNK